MPEEFGRYELHDLLGRGGMGEVYRAVDTVRERSVALKLLSKHLAADESFKSRFRRESRMVARLNEPHIIPIHDFGEIDNQLFIDMRLVEGADLGTVLATGRVFPVEVAVGVITQVASALDAAHRSGLVHRDVKPSNVLLTGLADDHGGEPFAYLVDFGIAHSATQEGTVLTATTGTVGTVAYMSPERIGGDSGDHTTDVYALACVLYEMLTGHKPFDGELFAMMYAHMHTAPPKVTARVPDTPAGLDEVIARGMAKTAEDRYATAGEFSRAARAALRAAGRSAPPLAGPSSPQPTESARPSSPVTPLPPQPAPPASPASPAQPPAAAVPREQVARSGSAAPPASPPAGPPVTFAPTPPPTPRTPAAAPPWQAGQLPPPVGEPRRDIPPPVKAGGWQGSAGGGGQWSTPPGHPSGPVSPYQPGPPPRPDRRRAMIAGAAVLLIALVGLTAYLLAKSDKKPTAAASSSISASTSSRPGDFPSASSGSGSSGAIGETQARAVVERYFNDVNAQDRTDAEGLICPELRTGWRNAIDKSGGDFTVSITNQTFKSAKAVASGLELEYSLDVKSISTSQTGVTPVTFTVVDRTSGLLICGEK